VIVSAVILVAVFVLMIVFIGMDKTDRAVLSLTAAVITYFVLIFLEGADFEDIVDILIGTPENGFVNIHSVLLIIGMMLIIQISITGGLFQFLSFKLIQYTKAKPIYLLLILCTLSVFITAIFNDILTVIMLIPLTIEICRILEIDPIPYVIGEAILIKLGASILIISSIPNILISGNAGLSFGEFFLSVGVNALILFGISLVFFSFIYRKTLKSSRASIDILLDINVWNFVPDKALMYKSTSILILVMIGFVVIPSDIIPPDIIVISMGMVLLTISKLDAKEVLEKIDFKLILYLFGIFVLSGGLEYVGFISFLTSIVTSISTNDILVLMIIVLWICGAFSAFIDNIPITQLLIPIVQSLAAGFPASQIPSIYAGMVYGINMGDNFTPFGDTLLVINTCEANKVKLSPKAFFNVAFKTCCFQFGVVTLIFCVMMDPILRVIILSILSIIVVVYIIKKRQAILELLSKIKKNTKKTQPKVVE
jgi:Na+/H+ antiporter NhaD/arsenite permease-like protein